MDNPLILGVELGSTRIKAVTIDGQYRPVSSGSYTWSSSFENGIWTYPLEEVWTGLRSALAQVENRHAIQAMGISAMMHGYLAFDKDWHLLTPFRTWQNRMTAPAAEKLSRLFGVNIPQRWSIAHLFQAVMNREEHIPLVAHITTLAGYVHHALTGVHAVGLGDGSGIFPVDSRNLCYQQEMLRQFNTLLASWNVPWNLEDLLPSLLPAGAGAGTLTEEGAALLDHLLPAGIALAPPEGDAGTGMTATNAVAPRTGNVSAGTSIFAMVVLEKPLQKLHPEIDLVTTPAGRPVAMVHCNNCTGDTNAWAAVLHETAQLFGAQPNLGQVYTKMYEKSLEGEPDCGGVLVCNYLAGEGITGLAGGRPLVVRAPDAHFNLANFLRAMLYSTMATLKIGMDILASEHVAIDTLTGHGGLFITPGVCQKYLAAACNTPVACMETAGEGGPYGMALLASYLVSRSPGQPLEQYLSQRVFAQTAAAVLDPDPADVAGFNAYMERYKALLAVEKAALEAL